MRSVWSRLVAVAAALACGLGAALSAAQAPAAGVVSGRVVDGSRGEPLPGALVRIEGTALSAPTDRQGAFRLTGVPAGPQTVVVSFIGRVEGRQLVTVSAATAATIEIRLEPDYTYSESVTVTGESIQEGQARALNQQRTALNITNVVAADQIGSFPDPNAAEAASRIPGVSITRDQGEGRYILVRGTEARLNSVMVDGERLPAPEGDTRQVMLDAIPADQLQAIEVSKALTPDMDADAIGGAVNLVTRQAVARTTLLLDLAGGYSALQSSADQQYAAGTAGRRFNGGKVGLLAGFSLSQRTRGSENFEAEYDGDTLDDLQLRDYAIERNRYAFNVSSDVRLSDTATLTLKAIVNRFEDYEENNRIRYRPGNRRIEHIMKNRNQNQNLRSFSVGATYLFASGSVMDWRAGYGFGEEIQPDRLDTIFRQTGINFTPSISDPNNIQPGYSANNAANARLNAWETELFETEDRDWTGSLNFRTPFGSSASSAKFLKAGVKIRDKRKTQQFEIGSASPAGTVLFPSLQDNSFDNAGFLSYFNNRYDKFPGIDATASRNLFNALPASAYEIDPEGDASNYEASEQVLAGYAMAELFLTPRLTLLPGVRVESTKVDYTGYEVLYNADGDYEATRPLTGTSRSAQVLPGFHARFAVNQDVNLRFAYTRTLARPNYVDLVPYQLVFQEDNEIERGNSTLKPTTSDNLDVLAERYFRSVGLLSGGVFYKRMNDYIYNFRFIEQAFGDRYEVTQPQNGRTATLWGVELALQNQLRFLPAPFDGLGVYANYTWTDSNASYPDRSEDSTLPGQSRHLGNVSLWYEKHGLTAKVSWNFHGKYIDEVGGEAAEDVYYDDHTQVDINVGARLTRNIRLYADFLNLNNAPLRYFIGTTTRPIQQEYYRWWSQFGVKINW